MRTLPEFKSSNDVAMIFFSKRMLSW
jgi:hypothetical protein